MIELQHVNVKLLVKDSQGLDVELLVPIFHGWIQEKVFEDRLLDIADYRHVIDGPGVILIGFEGDYSVDDTDGRRGIRYNRKVAFEGSNQDRLKQAAKSALQAAQRLETETTLGDKLQFNGQGIEVFINDRLLAPNNEKTRAGVKADFDQFFQKLFAGVDYSLSYEENPRRLLTVNAKASRPFTVADLLKNLS